MRKIRLNELLSWTLLMGFFLLLYGPGPATFGLEPKDKTVVTKLIKAFKTKRKSVIAKQFFFPLQRIAPVPSIKNDKELKKRFNEVFDDNILKAIIKSDPDKDWSAVGWRGIMLHNGDLWIDYDGKIIAVNYVTQSEKDIRASLIAQQKKNLHESVSEFVEPVLEWTTEHYRIRIDDIGHDYRLAVWPSDKAPNEKPDIVLNHGKLEWEGSGGNHNFSFTDGNNSYVCEVVLIGTDSSPIGYYNVYKGNEYSDYDIKDHESIISEPVTEDMLDK